MEALPIGQRLAFDQAQGRLWVVCRKCERWNLTPFDERWEAIEVCERAYRDTPRRFSTDNIGLARLPSGLELVRIGDPLRPEFAAWRYGDQFGKRRLRAMVLGAGGLVAGTVATLAPSLFPVLGAVGLLASAASALSPIYTMRRTVARIRDDNGALLRLNYARVSLATAFVDEDDRVTLTVKKTRGLYGSTVTGEADILHGATAVGGLRGVLRALNFDGGSKRKVNDAARLVDMSRADNRLFGLLPKAGRKALWSAYFQLGQQGKELRLALEMAANEDAERVWLAGELLDLERAWRDAEEIAQIADGLGLPSSLDDQIERMK